MSMTMPSPGDGGDFAQPPEGNHTARCYRVIDLGTQQVEWQGEVKTQHKILVSWELCDELMEDKRPFSVHKRYTYSSHPKSNLRKDLESWRGQRFADTDFGPGGFELRNLLGVACMVVVTHAVNGAQTYTNVTSVAKLPKGLQATPPVNAEVMLSLDREEWDETTYNALSDGLRATIAKSPEYRFLTQQDPQAPLDAPTTGVLPPDQRLDAQEMAAKKALDDLDARSGDDPFDDSQVPF